MVDSRIKLDSKQSAKKKKMLLQIREELKTLEKEMKYSKVINLKIGAMRTLEISGKFMIRISPYFLGPGIIANLLLV